MSHSSGAVLFSDGLIMFCEYNGTSDVMQPNLYETREILQNNWRTHEWNQCKDYLNHRHENVQIATTYGRGFSWNGMACKECKCLLSPLTLDSIDYELVDMKDGLPDWFPNKELYK